MITIVTVNYNSIDFLELLVKTAGAAEIIVVDNSEIKREWKQRTNNVTWLQGDVKDYTHGNGLNIGLKNVNSEYVLIVDVDCHFLVPDWQKHFLEAVKSCYMLTVKGSESKPIRPACVMMRSADAVKYDWRATPGYQGNRITPNGKDVGISAYYEMRDEKRDISFMEITKPSRYNTYNGEEYGINGLPLVYHHWHGASVGLQCRQADYPQINLIEDKNNLLKKFGFLKKTRKLFC